jgi:glycosyltransferase involved in cell wall biosynthesis
VAHGLSPRGKYTVVRNGIDVKRFGGKPRTVLRARLVVGSVGRLTTEKGHRYLVPMLKQLPGAKLVIVGDGPERATILQDAERHGVLRRIDLRGEVDSAEVLRTFDVYVQPSLYESQGLAILEAMAAGVPVVATRVGGVAGVVRTGRTGVLVPPANPGAMAKAVKQLAVNSARTERMVRAALEQVRTRFSVDRMVREYERLYLRLLGG